MVLTPPWTYLQVHHMGAVDLSPHQISLDSILLSLNHLWPWAETKHTKEEMCNMLWWNREQVAWAYFEGCKFVNVCWSASRFLKEQAFQSSISQNMLDKVKNLQTSILGWQAWQVLVSCGWESVKSSGHPKIYSQKLLFQRVSLFKPTWHSW